MDDRLKKKWKLAEETYSFVDTTDKESVCHCFRFPFEPVLKDRELCKLIIEDHNRVIDIDSLVEKILSVPHFIGVFDLHNTFFDDIQVLAQQIKTEVFQ